MAPPVSRLEAALRKTIEALGDRRWALVGGLAVSSRCEPRFTRDIDLAVALPDDAAAETLVRSLLSRGFRTLTLIEQEAQGRLATVRLSIPGEEANGVVADLRFASCGIEAEQPDNELFETHLLQCSRRLESVAEIVRLSIRFDHKTVPRSRRSWGVAEIARLLRGLQRRVEVSQPFLHLRLLRRGCSLRVLDLQLPHHS